MGRYSTPGQRPQDDSTIHVSAIVRDALVVVGLAIAAGLWGCPTYNVWESTKRGEAEFQRAEQNRRIAVLEAQAKLDSAKLQAQAEVERAKGVAQANAIVADGLRGHEEYLRYLWIDKVASNPAKELIYVPTEAALPILEAGRRGAPTDPKPEQK